MPLWRPRRGFYPPALTQREAGVEVEVERERRPEVPQPAVALVATFHTVPPMPHYPICLLVPVRALTTSAAPSETPRTPSAVLLEEAAPKPKVFLQGVIPSSLRSHQVGICSTTCRTPHLSVFLIVQTSSRHSLCLTAVFSAPAWSSLTLKGLVTVLERVI